MTEPKPYSTPRGVETAIKDAARAGAACSPRAEDSEWALKGAARHARPSAVDPATRDIDLYRRGFTHTQALDDLIRLAAIDLGDHFRSST